MNETVLPTRSVCQCPFCGGINLLQENENFCAHCGIDITRLKTITPPIARKETVAASESDEHEQGEVFTGWNLQLDTSSDSIGDNQAPASTQPAAAQRVAAETALRNQENESTVGVLAEPANSQSLKPAQSRRLSRKKIITAASSLLTVVLTAGAITAVSMLGAQNAKREETAAVTQQTTKKQFNIAGFSSKPVWASKAIATAKTVRVNEEAGLIAAVSDTGFSLYNLKSGKKLVSKETSEAVNRVDTVAGIFAFTAGTQLYVATSSSVEVLELLPGEYSYVRGNSLFVTNSDATSFKQLILTVNTAQLAEIAAPYPGVVPVAGDSVTGTVLWGSNRGIVYKTAAGGASEVSLEKPSVEAKPVKWVGAVKDNLLLAVIWQTDAGNYLTFHNIENGEAAATTEYTNPLDTAAKTATFGIVAGENLYLPQPGELVNVQDVAGSSINQIIGAGMLLENGKLYAPETGESLNTGEHKPVYVGNRFMLVKSKNSVARINKQ